MVCDTIMDTIEAPRCSQRGFVLPSFKELLLEAMMEIIYKIIQRVNEGELKQMMIIHFQYIRCFQDKNSIHHTAYHMNAAAGVYVPATPDTTLTPVEEEGRDGLGRILRPNVSLAHMSHSIWRTHTTVCQSPFKLLNTNPCHYP